MMFSIRYFIVKFATAGTAFSLFYLVSLILFDWDLSSSNDLVTSKYMWLCFFGYAVISSIVIDYFLQKGKKTWPKQIIYYAIASVLVWLVLFIASIPDFIYYLFVVLYASFITVWCAWGYMLIYHFLKRKKGLSIVVLFVSLSFLVTIVLIQPSIQKGWQETYSNGSYQASFELFSGEEKVEMELKGNQSYLLTVNWSISEGGYGWKVREKNGYGNLSETNNEYQYILDTDYTGPYYFFISGDKAKGSVEVHWEDTNSK